MFLIAAVATTAISVSPMINRPVAPAPISRPVVVTPTHPAIHPRPVPLSNLPGHQPVQNALDCYRLELLHQKPPGCPQLFIVP